MNVKQMINRRYLNCPAHQELDFRIVPRDSFLRSIEGTYRVSVPPVLNRRSHLAHYLYVYFGYENRTYENHCNKDWCHCWEDNEKVDSLEYPPEILEILKTGMVGRLSVGRFFRRIYGKEFKFDLIETQGYDVEIQISCKYRDILKCSTSRNFNSCFQYNGIYANVPIQYLENPGVAIAYVRDKSGKFSSRIFLYLGSNNEILLGRPYGIIEHRQVYQEAFKNLNIVIPYHISRTEQKKKFYTKYPIHASYSDIMFINDNGLLREHLVREFVYV